MSSLTEMSLDDIINKKRKTNRNKNISKRSLKTIPFNNDSTFDARNKIILNKRKKVKDAREKLCQIAKQKDARLRLNQLRQMKQTFQSGKKNSTHIIRNQGKLFSTKIVKDRVFNDLSRQVRSQPLIHITKKQFTPKIQNYRFNVKPTKIVRTIENDIQMIDDQIDNNLNLKITMLNDLRNSTKRSNQTELVMENEKRSMPQSILKKRLTASQRNTLKEDKVDVVDKTICEYRIIVSNLRNTVTGGDIEELFGDLGGMVESRLVRPGTAEVFYRTLEDAQRAVDLYHNRQLDGQPMNCLLVTPRSNTVLSRSSSNMGLYSTNSNVEPDISTFHKVLFSHF